MSCCRSGDYLERIGHSGRMRKRDKWRLVTIENRLQTMTTSYWLLVEGVKKEHKKEIESVRASLLRH